MVKICSLSLAVIAMLAVLSGCSRTTSVTVTPSPVTATVIKTVSPQPATATLTVTATVTPTLTTSLYQGSLNCTWTGQANGMTYNGTFSLTIDANGDVKGSVVGGVADSVVGNVDLIGNLIAIGVDSASGTPLASSFGAKITISGNTMSVQGNFAGGSSSGTFSGTGTVTR